MGSSENMVGSLYRPGPRLLYHPLYLIPWIFVLFGVGTTSSASAGNTSLPGTTAPTVIECPAGEIEFVSKTHESGLLDYQRTDGNDPSKYSMNSTNGYCNVVIALTKCDSSICAIQPNVRTVITFNLMNDLLAPKSDNVTFEIPHSTEVLLVRFRFNLWEDPYLYRIEEAIKQHSNGVERKRAANLVKHLKYAYSLGIKMDPPRTLPFDYSYVPGLVKIHSDGASVPVASADSSPIASLARSSMPPHANVNSDAEPTASGAEEGKINIPVYIYVFIVLLILLSIGLFVGCCCFMKKHRKSVKMLKEKDKEIEKLKHDITELERDTQYEINQLKQHNDQKYDTIQELKQDAKTDFAAAIELENAQLDNAFEAYNRFLEVEAIVKKIRNTQSNDLKTVCSEDFIDLEGELKVLAAALRKSQDTFLHLRNIDQEYVRDQFLLQKYEDYVKHKGQMTEDGQKHEKPEPQTGKLRARVVERMEKCIKRREEYWANKKKQAQKAVEQAKNNQKEEKDSDKDQKDSQMEQKGKKDEKSNNDVQDKNNEKGNKDDKGNNDVQDKKDEKDKKNEKGQKEGKKDDKGQTNPASQTSPASQTK